MQSTELACKEPAVRRAGAASDMYQLLTLLLHPPTEDIAAGILSGSLAQDVAAILAELGFSDSGTGKLKMKPAARQGEGREKGELWTAMRREYTRLFNHPQKPAVDIYETLFLVQPDEEGRSDAILFVSPAALDAERCYKKAGLTRAKAMNEPPDHMATELEFMMYLHLQQAKALLEDNQEELAQSNEQIKEFSDLHLKKWAVPFFERCAAASESTVYRTMGQIGSAFIGRMLEEDHDIHSRLLY